MKIIFVMLHQRAAVMPIVFPALHTYAIPFDALNEGGPPRAIEFVFVQENQNSWATIW